MKWIAIALAVLVSACSLEQQQWAMDKFVANNKFGSSADVWLVKRSMFDGSPIKVALIFGFGDDHEFCQEIAELYMKRYPASTYSCSFAN
ncbi:MAG: hypothetical protein GEU95_00855 [Rhizobiales bacterium]|nr:hypothetical protein [Hyphomicrobiales bacterium]